MEIDLTIPCSKSTLQNITWLRIFQQAYYQQSPRILRDSTDGFFSKKNLNWKIKIFWLGEKTFFCHKGQLTFEVAKLGIDHTFSSIIWHKKLSSENFKIPSRFECLVVKEHCWSDKEGDCRCQSNKCMLMKLRFH
jgi:hypothetical protein